MCFWSECDEKRGPLRRENIRRFSLRRVHQLQAINLFLAVQEKINAMGKMGTLGAASVRE